MAKMETPKKKRQGFAAMPPEKRREIASKGGKAARRQVSREPGINGPEDLMARHAKLDRRAGT